jgi:hypothetical protein
MFHHLRAGFVIASCHVNFAKAADGASAAAFRLQQRQRPLKGVEQCGWEWWLKPTNETRKRNRDERRKRERMDRRCWPWRKSTRDL